MLSVIIVAWNVKDLLQQCLSSLFQTKQDIDFEVIVVDNASSDGTVEMIKRDFPQVKLIANQQNKGFAVACRQGADIAKGDYLLFLNDDTQVFDHSLDKTVKYLQQHPQVGVLGCGILNPDGSRQLSVRKLPRLFDQLVVLSKLHNFFSKLLSNYLQLNFDYQKTQEVEQVMGAYFLTPKFVWQKLGGFDPEFYLWFEEVDYCARAIGAGFKVIYFSEAEIIHQGGASFGQLSALPEQKIFNRSLLTYARKHWRQWDYWLLSLFVPINFVLTAIVAVMEKIGIKPNKHA